MIVILLFLGGLAAFVAWWLSRQGLATRPWLETGPLGAVAAPSDKPPAKLGLGIFLVVAGTLWAMLASAYLMRMELADWRPLPRLPLLWFNTGVLVLSSLALHAAQRAARRALPLATRHAALDRLRSWLLAGGITALIFLAGQVLAWVQLTGAGYRLASNPANAFFYLITAAHALHVLGGLVALARAGLALRQGADPPRLRLSVELCATYWHFLLLAWVLLFALLAYSPSIAWLYALCTAPFR